jgi:uncharacterized protein YndB with AHSA1/START domain
MELVRDVVIDRHIEEVFDFVADPLNDPRWCAKVLRVDQVEGDGPGPGARYDVLHRPIPFRPPRRLIHTCVAWEPPKRIVWHEDDGTDVFDVTYELESVWTATRLTQRDVVRLARRGRCTRSSGRASAATSPASCTRSSGSSSATDPSRVGHLMAHSPIAPRAFTVVECSPT